MEKITPIVPMPCTARELENKLHEICDNGCNWDGKVFFCFSDPNYHYTDWRSGSKLELHPA